MTEKEIGVDVNLNDIEDFTGAEIRDAAKVLNGIVEFVRVNGWKEGFRNNMSVDLTIACFMLKLEPEEFFNHVLLDLTDAPSARDFYYRLGTIEDYLDSWSYDPMYYMTNKDLWIDMCRDAKHSDCVKLSIS